MEKTYTQLYIHVVFSVQQRAPLIHKGWRDRLFQYITAIVQDHGHKMLAIGGVEDHIHLFFNFKPSESLSTLIKEIKRDSSIWINKNRFVKGRFSWQEGYGAFTYSISQIPAVCGYIGNQEAHHRKKTFAEEYDEILRKYGN
ncbi:MAG: IS200/IS605 family transposase [Bacteroidales bacterium]|nr:IS200/IS605 family transposase [Bacteroidales bacterium]